MVVEFDTSGESGWRRSCGVGYEPNTGAEPMPPKALFPQSMAGMVQRMRELDVVSEEFGEHVDCELLPLGVYGVNFRDPARG